MGRASASSALVVSQHRRGGSEEFGTASRIPDYLEGGVLPMSASHLCRRCGSARVLTDSGERKCSRCDPAPTPPDDTTSAHLTRVGRPKDPPAGKDAGEGLNGPESPVSASDAEEGQRRADHALIARLHRLAHLRGTR